MRTNLLVIFCGVYIHQHLNQKLACTIVRGACKTGGLHFRERCNRILSFERDINRQPLRVDWTLGLRQVRCGNPTVHDRFICAHSTLYLITVCSLFQTENHLPLDRGTAKFFTLRLQNLLRPSSKLNQQLKLKYQYIYIFFNFNIKRYSWNK